MDKKPWHIVQLSSKTSSADDFWPVAKPRTMRIQWQCFRRKNAALLLSPLHQNQAWNHPLHDSTETWTKNHRTYYCVGARMVTFCAYHMMCSRHRITYTLWRHAQQHEKQLITYLPYRAACMQFAGARMITFCTYCTYDVFEAPVHYLPYRAKPRATRKVRTPSLYFLQLFFTCMSTCTSRLFRQNEAK